MTEEQHNKDRLDLDEYLDGQSPISEAYRELQQPEPPAALDRAILQTAKEEAARGSKPHASSSSWQQWMKPLSVVAALGVCLAVVLQVVDQQPQTQYDAFLMKDPIMLRDERAPLLSVAPEQQPWKFASPAEGKQEQSVMAARQSAPMTEELAENDLAAPAPVDSLEDIVVTARKRAPGIAEVPQQITAASSFSAGPGLEEVVVARREPEATTAKVASTDALDAWEAGNRPAADVWIAGIRAFYEEGESKWADKELAKLRLQYPEAVAADGMLNEEAPETNRLSEISADQAAVTLPVTPVLSDLPDPDIWAAGIEWLYEQGEHERADSELEKFRRIYPDFEF